MNIDELYELLEEKPKKKMNWKDPGPIQPNFQAGYEMLTATAKQKIYEYIQKPYRGISQYRMAELEYFLMELKIKSLILRYEILPNNCFKVKHFNYDITVNEGWQEYSI